MRVLFVSNFYPPNEHGGYEQLCQEVAAELTRRTHVIGALTSRGQACDVGDGVQVHRLLNLEVEAGLVQSAVRLAVSRGRLERENLDAVRRVVAGFKPDAVLIWGMWNVPRSVPALVEQLLGDRVAYYLCDYWPSLPSAYLQQWESPPMHRLSRLPKWLIGRPIVARLSREGRTPLRLEHPICVSRAVRDGLVRAQVQVGHAPIIYNGTRPFEFLAAAQSRTRHGSADGLKVVYAGRVAPEKGVHTAIRALGSLSKRTNRPVSLDIVGYGTPAYERQLTALAQHVGVADRVRLLGGVPRAEMPSVLAQYDVLVFPSEWAEPLGRSMLEAMFAELAVVGTDTGGTAEVLIDGETGLTFQPGDADALAARLQELLDQPELRVRLGQAGRRCVEAHFTLGRMVDELELELHNIVQGAKD